MEKVENGDCCIREFEDEVCHYGMDPADFDDKRKVCGTCGAGVNGFSVYRGEVLGNSFDPQILERVKSMINRSLYYHKKTQRL